MVELLLAEPQGIVNSRLCPFFVLLFLEVREINPIGRSADQFESSRLGDPGDAQSQSQ